MFFVYIDFILHEWRLVSTLAVMFVLYYHYTNTFDYFEKKGIQFMQPTILLGNLGSRVMLKGSFHEFQKEVYDFFTGLPYGGFFEGRRPLLIIRDPDLIKSVMIRDFEYFVDRNRLPTREPNYIRKMLLNLKGSDWKHVRSTLTPAFSSSRLRSMLPIINSCSKQMVELLHSQGSGEVEMKNFMGRFTLEVIGTCAFGIECDAFQKEPSHFVKVAQKLNELSFAKRMVIFFILFLMPNAFRFVNVSFMNRESTDELVRMVHVTKTKRRSGKAPRRNDLLQMLIDAVESEKNKEKASIDDDTLDAQALLFLIAGYETSSTLLSFAVHALATHPDVQERVRRHVLQVLSKRDGEIDYETLAKMDYLESFLQETLRVYPPVARVDRVCTKPYTLPGTSIKLDEGAIVGISVYGIHMDARHYPDPEQFRPERFSAEEKRDRPAHLFLPFGAGPRNCIGLRFAMMSTKLAMAALIKDFEFSACDKTVHPVQFAKKGFLLKPAKGLWVRVSPVDS